MKRKTKEALQLNCYHLHQISNEFILIDVFSEFQRQMQWFRTSGEKLLRKKTITFEQWEKLRRRICELNRHLPCPAIAILHLKILKKGADSLADFSTKKSWDLDRSRIILQWLNLLKHALEIDDPSMANKDPLQLGTGYTKHLRWQVVESLVPAAQVIKSEHNLKEIAQLRYGDDYLSVGRFFEMHKNW